MRTLLLMFIIYLFLSVSNLSSGLKLMHLPSAGVYKLNITDIYNCNASPDNVYQYNLFVNHKNNKTEILGNLTNKIAFDDSLFMEINVAAKNSQGSWIDNTFIHKLPKGCSSIINTLGKAWNAIKYGFGLPNATCPIPSGVYIGTGVDIAVFKDSSFPHIFIYGTYKIKLFFTRGRKLFGCNVFVIELSRP